VSEGDYYSVSQAAKVLKVTTGRIRQMLGSGELEGEKDEAGHWVIPAHAVHDRPRPPRIERVLPASERTPPVATQRPERLSELESEVRELRYRLGLSEGRLELTEKAESTLRESLQREQERADNERERADRLQGELDQARRPWWRKFFGIE
jgi:excisionase family DNA binding protein